MFTLSDAFNSLYAVCCLVFCLQYSYVCCFTNLLANWSHALALFHRSLPSHPPRSFLSTINFRFHRHDKGQKVTLNPFHASSHTPKTLIPCARPLHPPSASTKLDICQGSYSVHATLARSHTRSHPLQTPSYPTLSQERMLQHLYPPFISKPSSCVRNQWNSPPQPSSAHCSET